MKPKVSAYSYALAGNLLYAPFILAILPHMFSVLTKYNLGDNLLFITYYVIEINLLTCINRPWGCREACFMGEINGYLYLGYP